ncbi:hypothetical protein ABT294_13555 [Nonomuraea sp. NPDC000554]|uniref:hypothetical protein n=1 Tax=Nonomuraea sp. NPDC000554 TaxID=3154259 RepID=UPI00331B52F5
MRLRAGAALITVPTGGFLQPALTTVRPPLRRIADVLIQRLQRTVENDAVPSAGVPLPGESVVRSRSGGRPRCPLLAYERSYIAPPYLTLSAVRATRAALPSLVGQRGVVISPQSARMPHSGPVTYTTAKSALTVFGKALSEEFEPQGGAGQHGLGVHVPMGGPGQLRPRRG